MTFNAKIGVYLLVIGFLAMALFFASDQAGEPYFILFCAGVTIIPLAFYLIWHFRNPPTPSDRFSTLRRLQEQRRQRKNKQTKK